MSIETYHRTEEDVVRDRIERDLYEKPEIHEERRHNLVIRVYWLRLTNEISLILIDEAQSPPFTQETIIPPNEDGKVPIQDAIDHPTLRFPKQSRGVSDD